MCVGVCMGVYCVCACVCMGVCVFVMMLPVFVLKLPFFPIQVLPHSLMTSSSKLIANCFIFLQDVKCFASVFFAEVFLPVRQKSDGCSLITACQSLNYCSALIFYGLMKSPQGFSKLNNVSGSVTFSLKQNPYTAFSILSLDVANKL